MQEGNKQLEQPQSSGLIPAFILVWVIVATVFGLAWLAVGCYESFMK